MKYLKLFKLFETSVPTDSPELYYHGCSNEDKAKSIIEEGSLHPGNMNTPRGGKLTPVMGRTYVTPMIEEAGIYAIGANILGNKVWDDLIKKDGRYGYMFVIESKNLGDVVPDEDYIGQALYHTINNKYYDSEKWQDKLKAWSDHDKISFTSFAKDVLTPLQYEKVRRYDDYADLAVAGKKMMKSMPDWMKQDIMSLGVPVANLGPIKISESWKIDKNLCEKLKKDGSNFFEIAEKL